MPEVATRQGGAPSPPGRTLDSRGPPVRRLMPFFFHKNANFMIKIWAKDSPQSELWISGYKRNGEGAESGNAETERDRERKRDRSNLGGALAPPKPWEPRNRGETLPPSREKVKEEEEEGGLSPPCFRWRRNAAGGHHHHRDLHQHRHHLHQHLHHLPPSIYSGPLSRNPLYPLLEHGALCFILLSNDMLPSYDV